MYLTFRRKRIAGVLVVLPSNERSFVEEMKQFDFPEARSLKLKEMMGYDKHRLVDSNVCVSDLAVFGLEHLFEQGSLEARDIDALVVVTVTPDHFMPPTSNIIQGRLGLKQDMFCLDLNQACVGYVVGLIQAFMLLEHENIRKVVLVNGDVLSRKVSPQDRNIYPLIGDAASITVVERDPEDSIIHANVMNDGARGDALAIPAGGMRLPSGPGTALLEDGGDHNYRAKDHLYMDGPAVFNFVMRDVPPLICNLLDSAGVDQESVDYFLCHQPNRFMLQKMADKLKIPYAKMPNNVVERFGNSGSGTIPTAITLNLPAQLKKGHCQACLVGFGAGLAWGAMLLRLGGLGFCEIIEHEGKP
jgi:3-oxoacyl-[acyl-carrier-protein] synthase-3